MKAPSRRLPITVDGREQHATIRFSQPSAHVLTAHTVLPDPSLAVEVHSTFVGHPGTRTYATHLLLGPVGAENKVVVGDYDQAGMQPGTETAACVYEHLTQLLDLLREHGHDVCGLDVPQLRLSSS